MNPFQYPEDPRDYEFQMMQQAWEQERDEQPQDFTQEPVAEPIVEPVNNKHDSKLQELIAAYPNMRFLTKNPDTVISLDEWYDIMEQERSGLGVWGTNPDDTFLPSNFKYSVQQVYVKLISYYHYNGNTKQRAFFSIPLGLGGAACVHSGAVTKGLKTGWNQVSFTTMGTEMVHGRKVNKVSSLKSDSF